MKKYRGRRGRQKFALQNFSEIFNTGTVVDVGGGDNNLVSVANTMGISSDIFSVDLFGNPSVRLDLDQERIPLSNRSVGSVVALEVLEHLENIHVIFDQLLHIGRTYFLFTLPNMLHWYFRVKYMLGRTLSGKYGLTPETIKDRHRWITSVDQARKFTQSRISESAGDWNIHREILTGYQFNRYSARFVNFLIENFGTDNLRAWTYWCLLKRS